jgi:hypothetical protein
MKEKPSCHQKYQGGAVTGKVSTSLPSVASLFISGHQNCGYGEMHTNAFFFPLNILMLDNF